MSGLNVGQKNGASQAINEGAGWIQATDSDAGKPLVATGQAPAGKHLVLTAPMLGRTPNGVGNAIALRAGIDAVALTFDGQPGRAESLKSMLNAANPLTVARAEKLLAAYHKQLKVEYPGEGEIEPIRTYKAYMKRTDIDWDQVVFTQGKEVKGGAHINLFTGADGKQYGFSENAWIHNCSQKDAAAAFRSAYSKLEAGGAEAIGTEMNDAFLMRLSEHQNHIDEDAKRTPYRCDNPDFMCGSPNDANRPGLGFQIPNAIYHQRDLNPGDEPVTHLCLGVRIPNADPQPKQMLASTYLEAVRGYIMTYEITRDEAKEQGKTPAQVVDAHPTFRTIAGSVKGQTIALLDPATPRPVIAAELS